MMCMLSAWPRVKYLGHPQTSPGIPCGNVLFSDGHDEACQSVTSSRRTPSLFIAESRGTNIYHPLSCRSSNLCLLVVSFQSNVELLIFPRKAKFATFLFRLKRVVGVLTGGFGVPPISQCHSGGSPFFYHISLLYASGNPLREMLHLGKQESKVVFPT